MIGSYLSNRAVVLLGQPIITLDKSLQIVSKFTNQPTRYIEQDAGNMSIQMHFLYDYSQCSRIGKFHSLKYIFDSDLCKYTNFPPSQVPLHFLHGSRLLSVIHARLRLNCSDLKRDLFNNYVSTSDKCQM